MELYETDEEFSNQYKSFPIKNGKYMRPIGDLLLMLEKEENPIHFKDQLMAITQLYFDGICENQPVPYRPHFWSKQIISRDNVAYKKQQVVMKDVFAAGIAYTREFYGVDDVNYDFVREKVLIHSSEIQNDSSKLNAKKRWTTGVDSRLYVFAKNLKDEYKTGDFDVLVGIASGGFEPSFLAMNVLGIDSFLPIRYSLISREDKEILVPGTVSSSDYLSSIGTKKVLLIDDFVMAGVTIRNVEHYLKGYNYKSIDSRVINGKPQFIDPRFF